MSTITKKQLRVGELAEQAGVGIETVRFYERRGLLKKPQRTAAGYRQYDAATVSRIRFIRRIKDLGFSLQEIAQLLELQDTNANADDIRVLTQQKVAQIEARIEDLQRIKAALLVLESHCPGADQEDSTSPLVDLLATSSHRRERELSRRNEN